MTPTSRPSTSRCQIRCTSNGAIRALEAGKHVLCEKPLSRSATEVERAFDISSKQPKTLLMEAFMYRHHPQTRRLTELVTQGAVGKARMIRAVVRVRGQRPEKRPPEQNTRRRRPDGRRVLLRERRPPDCRRARARVERRAVSRRPTTVSTSRSPAPCGSPDDITEPLRRRSGARQPRSTRGRRRSGNPASRRSVALPEPGIELIRGDGSREPIEINHANSLPARGREPLRRDPGRGRAAARSSRRARSGQTIEALYQAADDHRVVTLR